MNSKQHRARAAELRQKNPKSRAAALHDITADVLDKKAAGEDPETAKLVDAYARKLNQPDADIDAET